MRSDGGGFGDWDFARPREDHPPEFDDPSNPGVLVAEFSSSRALLHPPPV
jgi:hypothetical protein